MPAAAWLNWPCARFWAGQGGEWLAAACCAAFELCSYAPLLRPASRQGGKAAPPKGRNGKAGRMVKSAGMMECMHLIVAGNLKQREARPLASTG